MFTIEIKYAENSTFLKKATLSNLKHYLKENKCEKPYSPLGKHMINYTLSIAYESTRQNKKVKWFKLEK